MQGAVVPAQNMERSMATQIQVFREAQVEYKAAWTQFNHAVGQDVDLAIRRLQEAEAQLDYVWKQNTEA